MSNDAQEETSFSRSPTCFDESGEVKLSSTPRAKSRGRTRLRDSGRSSTSSPSPVRPRLDSGLLDPGGGVADQCVGLNRKKGENLLDLEMIEGAGAKKSDEEEDIQLPSSAPSTQDISKASFSHVSSTLTEREGHE